MPLPRLKSSRTDSSRPRAASQSRLDQSLDELEGVWSRDGEILNLPGWHTLKYKELKHDLIIRAELTTEPEHPCRCEAPDSEFRRWGHTGAVCIYDLPIRNKRTRIYCKLQRFRCTACGKTTQQAAPGLDEQHHMTNRLVKYIESESFNIAKTFTALADEVGVSVQLIRNMFTVSAEKLEEIRRIETPEWLAMDEVYIKRKARAIITDPLRRQVVDILPSNSQDVVSKWLLQIPNRINVKMVTIDMWPSYLGAIRRLLPQAAIIVDRYHVHNLLNCAIKDVLHLLRGGMSYSEQRERMRDPNLLFKSKYNLREVPEIDEGERRKMCQKKVVEKWLKDVPELATAYRLKEDFSDILQMNDRQKAEVEVDLWLERVREFVNTFRIRLQKKAGKRDEVPFSNVLTVIKMWREYILNYISYKKRFELRPTNAFAECANGQVKRAQRLGNGYTYEVLRAKVVHGGLLMKRRPRLMLEEIAPRARRGSGRPRQGELQPKTNPNGNVIRLENVRESRDETKGLVPKSQSNEAWAKRFENLLQEVPSSGPNRMNFPIDIKEPDTNPKKTRKKRVSRPTREMPDKSYEQLRMF